MIAAFALALAVQSHPPVCEVVDPSSRTVSIQAVVKLPKLSGHETAIVALIADTIGDEVEGYSRTEMRDIAAEAGERLEINLTADHLSISYGAPASDMRPAIAYVSEILQGAHFPEESIKRALGELPYRTRSLWSMGLDPSKLTFGRLRREDILEMYHRICRPENVWLAVGGPIKQGEASDYWESKIAGWNPGKMPRPSLDQSDLPVVSGIPGTESIYELRGEAIPGDDAALSTRILALIALGSGKDCAMFDSLREAHAWSYRQEGILWPSVDGFVPRLIMASDETQPPADLEKEMREALVAAVKGWSDADLRRAQGMASGILMRGVPMSPLYLNGFYPVTDSLDDQTFMAAFWLMKTGRRWSPSGLVHQMSLVTLGDLKDAANSILEGSTAFCVPARQ